MNALQAVAADYASHGLTVIPALPGTKKAAIHWKPFQHEPPSEAERDAMFSFDHGLNIAVVCGSASKNLGMIDAETSRAFDDQLIRCVRAGLDNTWIDRTPSEGGHIWLILPVPVKPREKINDVEVRAQGQIALAPPSIAASKIDGSLRPYEWFSRPKQILQVDSLDQVHWLNLEPASLHLPFRAFPRKAQALLKGERSGNYDSRSEVEQAIVTVLVNAAFSFEEILSAFRHHPAAGKFAELERKDPARGIEWLRLCFSKARSWCIEQSPGRRTAGNALAHAASIPWRGHSGSSDRAVFLAHAGLAYRAGHSTYHASTRDLAELAGCNRTTASRATKRLRQRGFLQLIAADAFTFARRYKLEDLSAPEKKVKLDPLPTTYCEGVVQVSSFLLPDAFRQRGLGRPAYEVLQAFQVGPLTVAQVSEKTGRHVQTIRKSLERLREFGLVAKTGKVWRGRAVEDINLDELAKAVGMRDARKHQQERHNADRLRHRLKHRLNALETVTTRK